MKKTILLSRGQERQIESEEKYLFTRSILENEDLGLVLDNCFPESYDLKDFTVEHKVKLRTTLLKYGIQIIDTHEGDTVIMVGDSEMARWYKPYFELKSDSTLRGPPYVVLYVQTSSAFDAVKKVEPGE